LKKNNWEKTFWEVYFWNTTKTSNTDYLNQTHFLPAPTKHSLKLKTGVKMLPNYSKNMSIRASVFIQQKSK